MYVYVYMYVCVYTHNAEDVFRVKYVSYIGYIGMCIHKYTVHTVYSSQYILFSIQMLQPSSTMVYRVYSLQSLQHSRNRLQPSSPTTAGTVPGFSQKMTCILHMHFWPKPPEGQNQPFPRENACFLNVFCMFSFTF